MGQIDLSKACKNSIYRVVGFDSNDLNASMIKRLRDLGFSEDCSLEVLHFGPLGADPVMVRLGGQMVALRRREAALVTVTKDAV